jgi:hypothetical protein
LDVIKFLSNGSKTNPQFLLLCLSESIKPAAQNLQKTNQNHRQNPVKGKEPIVRRRKKLFRST